MKSLENDSTYIDGMRTHKNNNISLVRIMIYKKLVTLGFVALVTVGCATDDPNRRAKTGGVIGAVAGAVIGNQVGTNSNGKFVGAAVGALTGAAVGTYMDKQHARLQQQLAAEQSSNEIALSRPDGETIKLDVDSEVTFDVNSAGIKSSFKGSLDKVADIIADYDQTAVHIVGHTDSTGSNSYNQQLSEKRAISVARYLNINGIQRTRLRSAGRGETQPVADNSSSVGRSKNRRVEIYLKPIVQGREQDAFVTPY